MIDKLGVDIECLKKQFETDTNELRSDRDKVESKYNTLLNKKLTWKERYKGIIIEK
jgi:FtsZ-binding cell division protein ZapB